MNFQTKTILLLAALGSTSMAAGAQVQVSSQQIGTIPQRPTCMSAEPGNPSRLYVGNKLGRIYLIDNGQINTSNPFMDISALVNEQGEGGFLGIAMDPDYATNGFFYVSYTAGAGFGDSVVSRFSVSASNPNQGDPTSEQILLGPIAQTTFGHKGGDLRFGPDGMLYFAIGDGWAGGMNVDLRAQDNTDPRGSILRLDVDAPFPHVAAGNPLIGVPGADERIWAMGLRNPFRIGMDLETGELLIGDVGQSATEELNYVPSSSAGPPTNQMNFGWPCKEGTGCFGGAPAGCVCTNPDFRDPAVSYDHSLGCAIVAGTTYHGSAIAGLDGFHVYSDFCTGTMWADEVVNGVLVNSMDLSMQLGQFSAVVSIVPDAAGELYIMEHFSGRVTKIVPDCGTETYCMANVNSSGSLGAMASPGSFSVSDNNFELNASGLPSGEFAFFIGSSDQGFVPLIAGGQGNLCLGGSLLRFNTQIGQTSAAGVFTRTLNLNQFPANPVVAVMPGDVWHFQLWHRDLNPAPTFNFTEGLSVTFCP